MKKVFLGLSIAALVMGSFGCSKKSEGSSSETAAAGEAEVLNTIEAKYQRNDATATDPNSALTCIYISGQNNGGAVSLLKAEVKTSGSCNWGDLAGKAASAGAMTADAAAKILNVVVSDSSLPASARDKWDCTAINIRTNARQVGMQDCADGKGTGASAARSVAQTLGL